ncbi:hypothetical protein [Coleofasciculus sp. F4-SAH-05]|uniref:hypothetical protein n=1 Tax=Coleofasciculus sp. F4-SAH-05 TaxID=3069525 RepID=UPI004062B77F
MAGYSDANAGEITFSNADCAEEFTIAEAIDAIPGSVMVLRDRTLRVCCSTNRLHSRLGDRSTNSCTKA